MNFISSSYADCTILLHDYPLSTNNIYANTNNFNLYDNKTPY